MMLDADTSYRALTARDRRFDGLVFVGVKTTGIYCRPVCPARTPARARCQFFASAAEAEAAGFRACFRCRPELAPGLSPAASVPRLVRVAAARIGAGYLNDHSVGDLAAELGVSDRHLRRAMEAVLGVSPVALAQTQRLALAKQLLHDTALPLADVAFAAGFSSVRRFNAAFLERFSVPPTTVRRSHGHATDGSLLLRLDYRPPHAWQELIAFLSARAIPGVEVVDGDEYRRTVTLGGSTGWVSATADERRHAVLARASLSLAPVLMGVASRLRALFDLDARPDVVSGHLGRDPLLGPFVAATPGLRVPGAFDPFELAMRAILGQQVTVRGATTLSGRFAAAFGRPLDDAPPGLGTLFPTPAEVAHRKTADVAAIGMPGRRAEALVSLARAVAEGAVDLSSATPPAETIAALCALPGIGEWTAHYIAMRAIQWPDAFPAADLAIRKALGTRTAPQAAARAEAWRPWRAYAAMHLWSAPHGYEQEEP